MTSSTYNTALDVRALRSGTDAEHVVAILTAHGEADLARRYALADKAQRAALDAAAAVTTICLPQSDDLMDFLTGAGEPSSDPQLDAMHDAAQVLSRLASDHLAAIRAKVAVMADQLEASVSGARWADTGAV